MAWPKLRYLLLGVEVSLQEGAADRGAVPQKVSEWYEDGSVSNGGYGGEGGGADAGQGDLTDYYADLAHQGDVEAANADAMRERDEAMAKLRGELAAAWRSRFSC